MGISKRIAIPVASVGLVGATLFGASQIMAAGSQPGTLAEKIASEFHLDANKVQAVIDQNKSQQAQNRELKYQDRLAQAVTDGKITADQKQAILAERTKLQGELSGLSSMTAADREAKLRQVRQEAKAWASANGIDAKWLAIGRIHADMAASSPSS